MVIVVSKDGGASFHVPSHLAREFYRAFRAELWRKTSSQRDPKVGDTVLGVTITSLTV